MLISDWVKQSKDGVLHKHRKMTAIAIDKVRVLKQVTISKHHQKFQLKIIFFKKININGMLLKYIMITLT